VAANPRHRLLPRELEEAWLDPQVTALSQVLAILARSTGVPLDAFPVSRLLNKPTVDGKELIQPVVFFPRPLCLPVALDFIEQTLCPFQLFELF
jgi:hypothetical protein